VFPPNPFHAMSDDQLAEWHMQGAMIDTLTRDLEISRRATEAVQRHAAEREQQMHARLDDLERRILALTAKQANQLSANRKLCAQQVELIRVLRNLAQVCALVSTANVPDRFLVAWERSLTDAASVLKDVDFPF